MGLRFEAVFITCFSVRSWNTNPSNIVMVEQPACWSIPCNTLQYQLIHAIAGHTSWSRQVPDLQSWGSQSSLYAATTFHPTVIRKQRFTYNLMVPEWSHSAQWTGFHPSPQLPETLMESNGTDQQIDAKLSLIRSMLWQIQSKLKYKTLYLPSKSGKIEEDSGWITCLRKF